MSVNAASFPGGKVRVRGSTVVYDQATGGHVCTWDFDVLPDELDFSDVLDMAKQVENYFEESENLVLTSP